MFTTDLSRVFCHNFSFCSKNIFIFILSPDKVLELVDEGSLINGAYSVSFSLGKVCYQSDYSIKISDKGLGLAESSCLYFW